MNTNSGAILVLSGPSGSGKSSLIGVIKEHIGDHYFSISSTTRAARDGEIDGVHYHFLDEKRFKQEIEDDQFLEYAFVHGNYYGTSIAPVKQALKDGKLVIFDIDVQGADAVKHRMGDITTSVFITTPSLSTLKKRLSSRGTDTQDVIDRRLEMACREISRMSEYDYIVINDDLDHAAKIIIRVALAARLKVPTLQINEFVQQWEQS